MGAISLSWWSWKIMQKTSTNRLKSLIDTSFMAKKEILKRFSINITNLKKAEKILEEFESLQERQSIPTFDWTMHGDIAITAAGVRKMKD